MKTVFITLFALVLLGSASHAFAADLMVTCASGGPCITAPTGTPLFSNANLVPGNTVTKSIDVVNNNTDSCAIELAMNTATQSNNDFVNALFTVISDTTGDIFGVSSSGAATSAKTLTDVAAESPVSLGAVAGGDTKTYTWYVTFDPAVGNTLQGAQTEFSFNLNFTCDEQGSGSGPGGGSGTVGPSDGDDGGSGDSGNGDEGAVAGSSSSSTGSGSGIVSGSTSVFETLAKQPVISSVLGASALAATGTFADKLTYTLFILGVLMSIVGVYGWTKLKRQTS